MSELFLSLSRRPAELQSQAGMFWAWRPGEAQRQMTSWNWRPRMRLLPLAIKMMESRTNRNKKRWVLLLVKCIWFWSSYVFSNNTLILLW